MTHPKPAMKGTTALPAHGAPRATALSSRRWDRPAPAPTPKRTPRGSSSSSRRVPRAPRSVVEPTTGSSLSAEERYGKDVFEAASGEPDVIVIGSGIGGLCCGALCARYGMSVTVLESHDIPGGAAHAWERNGYHFESGPSLYSGMTGKDSTNPLAQVYNALDVELPVLKYKNWMCHLPEGTFLTEVGAKQFCDILREYRGEGAVREWENLQRFMEPLASASVALPPAAFRQALGALQRPRQGRREGRVHRQLARFALLPPLGSGRQRNHCRRSVSTHPLTLPPSSLPPSLSPSLASISTGGLDRLIRSLLSPPLRARRAFMFNEWYQPNCELDFPVGGSQGMVDALVAGLRKHGGALKLGAHVEEILVENGEARGVKVRYRNGGTRVLRAKKAVVSNASAWDTEKLLPAEA